MIKTITLIFFLFTTLIGFTQKDSFSNKEYKFKGRIINEITLTPHCGYMAFGTVIEFEIIEFSNSEYNSDTIGVIFTCPEFYKKNFFKVGEIYSLTLKEKNQATFTYSVPNINLLKKYNLDNYLLVVKAKKHNIKSW